MLPRCRRCLRISRNSQHAPFGWSLSLALALSISAQGVPFCVLAHLASARPPAPPPAKKKKTFLVLSVTAPSVSSRVALGTSRLCHLGIQRRKRHSCEPLPSARWVPAPRDQYMLLSDCRPCCAVHGVHSRTRAFEQHQSYRDPSFATVDATAMCRVVEPVSDTFEKLHVTVISSGLFSLSLPNRWLALFVHFHDSRYIEVANAVGQLNRSDLMHDAWPYGRCGRQERRANQHHGRRRRQRQDHVPTALQTWRDLASSGSEHVSLHSALRFPTVVTLTASSRISSPAPKPAVALKATFVSLRFFCFNLIERLIQVASRAV